MAGAWLPSSTSSSSCGGKCKRLRVPRPVLPIALTLLLAGCGEDTKTPPGSAGDAARGRIVYLAHCVACHNTDPAKVGPLGPPVKGSSRALLEARLVRGSYPPAYPPKRNSTIMQPMPHLASTISDLEAFLR